MRTILYLFFLTSFLSACANKPQKEMIDKTTVHNFELNRYLGTWYEIARYPHRFEKDLVGVTASYSLKSDGMIRVVNKGHKNGLDGPVSVAEGKAKMPDPEHPGRLKVSFFWIFYAEYNILELDTLNYQYAMIGSSSPNYFWILSRTPQLDDAVYAQLLEKAKRRGYDLGRIELVPQPILLKP